MERKTPDQSHILNVSDNRDTLSLSGRDTTNKQPQENSVKWSWSTFKGSDRQPGATTTKTGEAEPCHPARLRAGMKSIMAEPISNRVARHA